MKSLPLYQRIAVIAAFAVGEIFSGFSFALPQVAWAQLALQSVQGTKIRLQPPPDFIPADRFAGFVQESSQSSIVVTELPTAFDVLQAGLSSPASWQPRNITLLQHETVSIQGKMALLLHLQQSVQGQDWLKWVLAFGDDQTTTLITATFPQAQASQLFEALKQSLLSVAWDVSPAATAVAIDYTLQPAGDLKIALDLPGTKLFSKQGIIPSTSPEDPLFVVTPSFSPQTILDRADYAKLRLQKTEQMEAIQIQAQETVTIDGLPGVALTATATDSISQTPMTLYQVMLFEEDQNYFIMQGLVGTAIAQEYLPLFKQMAASFQRQATTAP